MVDSADTMFAGKRIQLLNKINTLNLFPVERHMRIVVHIGDLQIHMFALGSRCCGELHTVGHRPGKRRRAQFLPRFDRRGQLLAIQVHLPVATQIRNRFAGYKRRLRGGGNPLGQRPHHNHLRLIRPQHQRHAHRIALRDRSRHGMNLARSQVPILRRAASRNRRRASLRLVALVEEEVHVAVGEFAVRVGQPQEFCVQLHIRLGQRRDHRRRNVARWLNQRGKAQVRLLLHIQVRLVQNQARRLAHEDHLAARPGELLQAREARARNHRHRRQHNRLVRLPA